MHYCNISKRRSMALPSTFLHEMWLLPEKEMLTAESAKQLTSSCSESDGLCLIAGTCVGRDLKDTRNPLVISHNKQHLKSWTEGIFHNMPSNSIHSITSNFLELHDRFYCLLQNFWVGNVVLYSWGSRLYQSKKTFLTVKENQKASLCGKPY